MHLPSTPLYQADTALHLSKAIIDKETTVITPQISSTQEKVQLTSKYQSHQHLT